MIKINLNKIKSYKCQKYNKIYILINLLFNKIIIKKIKSKSKAKIHIFIANHSNKMIFQKMFKI